ncbi:hypothetical protein V1527DRAFT_452200 [Lipomyces starkeyi]
MSPQMATNAEEPQSYERPLHFLKANKPEKWFDIHLSYESFHALQVQAQPLYDIRVLNTLPLAQPLQQHYIVQQQ